MANDAPFAVPKRAAVGEVEEDDVEEDLRAAAELVEQRQRSGEYDVPEAVDGKRDMHPKQLITISLLMSLKFPPKIPIMRTTM